MKNKKILSVIAFMILLSFTACNAKKEDDREIIEEDGKEIVIIDDNDEEVEDKPNISVEGIDHYDNVAILDWLTEDIAIVSKENTSLEKMKLEELADLYPRSLYEFHVGTEEYTLLKEEENLFLGDATLSPDKRYLLYSGYSLGDATFHIMNLTTLEGFTIYGDYISAYSAEWADTDTVIGGSYSGGIYLASVTGEIVQLEGMTDEAYFVVRKMKDKIYYNTNSDETLMVYDQNTKEKTSLNIDNVYRLIPSPNENQLLIVQGTGSKNSLILYDTESGSMKTIAEGSEINGVSWSPDQRLIAYNQVTVENGSSLGSIYVYDVLTSVITQIVVDVQYPTTSWSPSGRKLTYTQWDGIKNSSYVVHLNILGDE